MRAVRSLFLTALVAVVGCDIVGIGNGRLRVFEVSPYKSNCHGLFETLCLNVRESGEEDFGNLFSAPAGFDYEWGFEYVILVEEHDVRNPPADGSSVRRELQSEMSKVPVTPGEQFSLTVPAGFLTSNETGGFGLLGEAVEILCDDPSLSCSQLDARAEAGARLRFTLAFPEVAGEPLEVVDWVECPEAFGPCSSS